MEGKVLPPQHQVFINFRGDELRKNFISHLVEALQRNDINFFTDKKEQKAEHISNLFKRIEESKIALAVFSKRYTESRWCLDELVKIKECADLGTLKVLPIFYNVSTDDVKLLNGEFGSHFRRECEYRCGQSEVNRWKDALKCVSGIIGLTFGEDSSSKSDESLSESDFIADIVKEVLILLQAIPSEQTKHFPINKHPERGETSSAKKNSKKSLEAQKTVLMSPPKAEIKGFTGSNYLAPQAIASGPTPVQGRHITIQFSQAASPANTLRHGVPHIQDPYNTVVQTSHGSNFTGPRPPYNGFPVRYGNHGSTGKGDSTSSMTNNSRKPLKPSKKNLEFTGTNGWAS